MTHAAFRPLKPPFKKHTQRTAWVVACLFNCVTSSQLYAQPQFKTRNDLELRIDNTPPSKKKPVDTDNSTYVEADKMFGDSTYETVLEGNVELKRDSLTLRADRLRYSPLTDRASATGNVSLQQPGLQVTGPAGSVKLGSRETQIKQPLFQIDQLKGKGKAEELIFDGVDTFTLKEPKYTVCPICKPNEVENADWYVEAEELELDQSAQVGRAKKARVVFQDVPILAIPYLSFPTSNRRKSGFLAPSFGSTSRSGTEVIAPYYWNIAPNRDVTLYPKVITRRGVQLGSETRYLGQQNEGALNLDYLPKDRKTDEDRYAVSFKHQFAQNNLRAGLNLNQVSDDEYFVDFSRTQTIASQRVLLQEAYAGYRGNGWDSSVRAVRHQTLQIEGDMLVEPYDRMPEVTLESYPKAVGPVYLSGHVQHTQFTSNTRPEGARTVAKGRVEFPFLRPSYSVKTALSVQSNNYNLTNTNPNQNANPSSIVPTFSMDGAVYFDRQTTLFGQPVVQSLEPRLFYLYTPEKDQDDQPLFDTTLSGQGFSRIFSENRYVGQDRVGDANQITAGATSRFVDEKTGAEQLRIDVGQRFYLTNPTILIPNEPELDDDSDFFISTKGQVTNNLSVDFFGQYDASSGRNEKSNITFSFSPEKGKQLNAGYRYTRNLIDQWDVSGQWPLGKGWSSVGRLNYSVLESRSIETIFGVEYNEDCWVARFVGQRFAVAPSQSTTSLFFQLELIGLGQLGANPIELLSRKVPGYRPTLSNTKSP